MRYKRRVKSRRRATSKWRPVSGRTVRIQLKKLSWLRFIMRLNWGGVG